MIIISPKSKGLGNQLFNIFAGIQYAMKHKKEFRIVWDKKMKNTYDTFFKNLLEYKYNSWSEALKSNEFTKDKSINDLKMLKEFKYSFTQIKTPTPDNVIIFTGYFHSYKYFSAKYKQILDLLNFDNLKKTVIEKYESLNTSQDICLTFNSSIHKEKFIADKDFYLDSLKEIIAGIESDKFVEKKKMKMKKKRESEKRIKKLQVISNLVPDENDMVIYPKLDSDDDEEEIVLENTDKRETYNILCCSYKKSFNEMMNILNYLDSKLDVDIKFTVIDDTLSDWEKMILTSNCKFNVISTNLLSWWSAYFCEVEDKEVYYPSKWYSKNINLSDFFPTEWNKIDVENNKGKIIENVTMELNEDHSNTEPGVVDNIEPMDKNLHLSIEEN